LTGHEQPEYKDGYCKAHWEYHFGGMTNHQRMIEKAKLRKERKDGGQ
jgi:hypothetical protein